MKVDLRSRWEDARFKVGMVTIAVVSVALEIIAIALLLEGGDDNVPIGAVCFFAAVVGIGIVLRFVTDRKGADAAAGRRS